MNCSKSEPEISVMDMYRCAECGSTMNREGESLENYLIEKARRDTFNRIKDKVLGTISNSQLVLAILKDLFNELEKELSEC